jgi:hypothetical protein
MTDRSGRRATATTALPGRLNAEGFMRFWPPVAGLACRSSHQNT